MSIPSNLAIGESILYSPDGADKSHVYICLMEETPETNALVLIAPMWTYDYKAVRMRLQQENRLYYGDHPFCRQNTTSFINHWYIKRQRKSYVLDECKKHYPQLAENVYARIIKNFLSDQNAVSSRLLQQFNEMRNYRKQYCSTNPCDDYCDRAFFTPKTLD